MLCLVFFYLEFLIRAQTIRNFCSALVPEQTSTGTAIIRHTSLRAAVADSRARGCCGCDRPMTAFPLRGYCMLPEIHSIPLLIGQIGTGMVIIRSPPRWPPPAPFAYIDRSTRIRMPVTIVISFIFAVLGYRQDCCWACLLLRCLWNLSMTAIISLHYC